MVWLVMWLTLRCDFYRKTYPVIWDVCFYTDTGCTKALQPLDIRWTGALRRLVSHVGAVDDGCRTKLSTALQDPGGCTMHLSWRSEDGWTKRGLRWQPKPHCRDSKRLEPKESIHWSWNWCLVWRLPRRRGNCESASAVGGLVQK